MGTLAKRYKKYGNAGDMRSATQTATGTAWQNQNTGNAIGMIGATVGQFADALGPADNYGKKSATSNILGGAGKGAATGAALGSVIPGVGTVIGGVVGGVAGAVGGIVSNGAQSKKAKYLKGQEMIRGAELQRQQTMARVNGDPTSVNGSVGTLMNGYFAAGGHLNVANQNIEDGTAKQLNSTAAEFKGPSHADGGIHIPGMQAEVEGNETTNGSYVFSDKLGFAKLHKPIATAIGKIEKKALSPERVSSIKLLKEKENQLKLSQEYTRHMLGLI